MTKPLRSATGAHVLRTEVAMTYLRLALKNAKLADSPKLQVAIRKAMKSADGARRHAIRRLNETDFPVQLEGSHDVGTR